MARDLGSIVKKSRREGYALHPKAHKYLIKKSAAPGQHGSNNRRGNKNNNNQYATQLREKQKIKRLYGLLEKQFATLFKKAINTGGVSSGDLALIMLEQRLDNAVYRAGFAYSRQAARQLVSHRHFRVNDHAVNIASIRLKSGDVVTIRPKSAQNNYFKSMNDLSPAPSQMPSWLKVDRKKIGFEVIANPTREDVLEEVNEQLVIEYYSR